MFDLSLLHPMIVHFPIALLIIAFLADAAGILLKREFFNKVGLLLLVLGTLGIFAAYFSGHNAAEGLTESGPLKVAIERHQEAAALAVWLMVATALLRTSLVVFKKYTGALRWIPLAFFLVGVLSVARTGYYGGELVFKHAAGVQFNIGGIGQNLGDAEYTGREDD